MEERMGFQLDKWELVNQVFLCSGNFPEAGGLTKSEINLLPKSDLYGRWRSCQCGSHIGNARIFFTWLKVEVERRKKARSDKARTKRQQAKQAKTAD
ncbi:hypothetical protein ACFL0L_00535 [Patescibacteria group bacterium]